MNVSSERKIVSAAKNLVMAFDKYLGEVFWRDVKAGAQQGDPICVPLLELHDAVKNK